MSKREDELLKSLTNQYTKYMLYMLFFDERDFFVSLVEPSHFRVFTCLLFTLFSGKVAQESNLRFPLRRDFISTTIATFKLSHVDFDERDLICPKSMKY